MKLLTLLLLPAAIWAGQARYARLARFEGPVEVQLTAADAWIPAERNLPLPESAWIRTGAAARVEIEFDDGGVWRIGPEAQGEISDYASLSTGQRFTLLSLDHGVAFFTGQARGFDSVVLAAPGAQVSVSVPAHIRLEARQGWSQIWVLGGTARFSCPAAELNLVHGQTARVEPGNTSRFFLERDSPATELDRWSAERDQAMANPASALHVMERSGLADLDAAGEWISTDSFGTVWKPKAAAGWTPFQNGRWRWYGELGYTWVSDDVWGWLPYHYGRWARTTELGWFWVPSVRQVFKPGDVYWLRGPQFAGWGPLAPGEQWREGSKETPQQYLDVFTTYAAFTPGAQVIDPAGFSGRPKDPLRAGTLHSLLPSPPFDAARLEATRPVAPAGSTRLSLVVPGVTYDPRDLTVTAYVPPDPERYSAPPVVLMELPPANADPEPELLPYPVPVYAGIVVGNAPVSPHAVAPSAPAATPRPFERLPLKNPEPVAHPKRWQEHAQYLLAERALQHGEDPALQIRDLDAWKRRYPYSDYENERNYYYMQAYSRMNPPQPAKVLAYAAPLVRQDVRALFENSETGRAETLNSLYLTIVGGQHIPGGGSSAERQISRMAAQKLLEYLPEFFAPESRPAQVSQELWTKARADMEQAARRVIGPATARRGH